MSLKSRIRKKQRRNFISRLNFSNETAEKTNNWQFLRIHEIPEIFHLGDEIDYWCHNKKDLYLLRIRKSQKEVYSIVKSRGRDSVIYLIVDLDFKEIDLKLLTNIVNHLESLVIPNWTVNGINQKFII